MGYSVEADDPLTGLRGMAVAVVMPGVTNVCDVQLLGKGALAILVRQANGGPATNASVELKQGSFPNDNFTGTTDTNGLVTFQNLFAGSYAVTALVDQRSDDHLRPRCSFGYCWPNSQFDSCPRPDGLNSGQICAEGPRDTDRFRASGCWRYWFRNYRWHRSVRPRGDSLRDISLISQDPVTGMGRQLP